MDSPAQDGSSLVGADPQDSSAEPQDGPDRPHHPFAYTADANAVAASDSQPQACELASATDDTAAISVPQIVSGAAPIAPSDVTPALAPSSGSSLIAPDIVFQTDPVSNQADIVVGGQSATNSYGVTGLGISVGVISDSFNVHGGAAAAEADGALPPAADVHILQDATTGTDEGQAMAEIVHSIAPNAQIYFYDSGASDTNMATAIAALQAAGCQIIVDDVAYLDEPYFQEGGTISQSVDQVVADGSAYFTAANNFGQSYYQGSFTPILNGGTAFEDFNVAGAPHAYYEPITIPQGASVLIDLQWAQPFKTGDGAGNGAGSNYSLAFRLLNAAGTTVNIGNALDKGGDPVQFSQYTNRSASTTFYLEVYENQTGTVSPGTFKIVAEDDSFSPVVFNDPNAATGSGTVFGHEEDPSAITVGAVPESDPSTLEPFSGSGPGQFYYDSTGTALPSPVTAGKVNLLAPDGNTTTIFNPFYGTSAAAPAAAAVGALVLEANGALDPADIGNVLEDSASPTVPGTAAQTGAGLVDAYLAVGEAETLTFSETASTGTLLGTHLDDTFLGGPGSHTINGEGGTDTLDYAAATAAVAVNFATGTATNGFGGSDSFSNIETVDGSAFNDSFVSGNAGETIYGGGGTDSLDFNGLGASGLVALAGGSFAADSASQSGSNAGTLDLTGGTALEIFGTLANAGSLIADGADLAITGALTGAGSALVENGGLLELGAGDAAGMAFGSGTSMLKLDNPLSFAGDAISGLALGDILDLTGITVASATIIGSALSIVESGGTNFAYAISGALAGDHFGTTGDGSTGTDLILESGGGITYAMAQATLNTPGPLALGNTRVGGTLAQALSITNSAAPPAEALDVSFGGTSGDATAAGTISLLAAGATNATSLVAGLRTATAGAQSGTVTLDYYTDGTGTDGNGQSLIGIGAVLVSGAVYREATGTAAAPATPLVFHVGDSGAVAITVTNTAANDGYSEDLVANVGQASGVGASGATGDIAAQGSSSAITATVSTASAGTINGSVTLNLQSDGTGFDGFGPTSIGTTGVAVNATVDNYAVATFEKLSGRGTLSQSGTSYTLSLGTVAAGTAPITVGLGVLNNVTGPADLLSGSFTTSGSSAFTLAGFGAFSSVSAGQADSAPSVTLATSTAGTFSETITLASTGSNSSGYAAALAPETLTITGTIVASIKWNGPSTSNRTGSFNTAADWSPALVPASKTTAVISNAGTYTVTSSQSNSIGALTLSDAQATLAVSGGTFAILGTSTNSGHISVGDAASLQLTGTMTDSSGSAMTLGSTGDATDLVIAGSAALKGAGPLDLSDNAGNAIVSNGATATLTNMSTIAGSGTIGDAFLTVVNSTGGVIDATGSAAALTLTGAAIKNTGALIEATGSAGLVIANTTVTAGTLSASGGNVVLSGATMLGGTLASSAGSVIATEGAADVVSGTTTTGTVTVSDGTNLTLKGTITNNGGIALDSSGDATDLVIAVTATLKGPGQLDLSDNADNALVSNGATATLTNMSTIAGSGTIGDAFLTLFNSTGGVIDATGSAETLTLTGTPGFRNTGGLIEATGSAGLVIANTSVTGGTVSAAGGNVDLVGASILGATLTSSPGSVFATSGMADVVSGATSTGTVSVSDGTALTLKSTITNNGVIALASSGDATDLVVAGTVALKGTGVVTMSDNADNAVVSNGTSATFQNFETIAGAGTIGDSTLTLYNEAGGTIDASDGDALAIATGTRTVTNGGLIEATGAGGLTIANLLTNSGTLAASGGNLTVSNQVSGTGVATIANGTLTFGNKVAATQAVSFAADTTGTLALGLAQSFAGTVAGFTGSDAIDLTNFAFSGTPSITSVSAITLGSSGGVAVKIKDGSLTATVDLLNQASITYSTSPSAYVLASDGNGAHPGTLLQLAPPAA